MKKANSTDVGDLMIYCAKTAKPSTRQTWASIHKNTANLANIIAAAATDVQIQSRVTPIHEQIREKHELFSAMTHQYWPVQKSLDIYDEWLEYHQIDADEFATGTFEVCHKIRPKKNALHITGPSNSGKSYILRSIRNGLMNARRMRCQASDNFTFGSCVDKSLIFTEEMWFTPQNVEEAKCILEGTDTCVNVKHQSERILKRTPCLSTSNDEPWRHVANEKQAMINRMFLFTTRTAMDDLKGWGTLELNPLMWLTIWQKHIADYQRDGYIPKAGKTTIQPKPSSRYTWEEEDEHSPSKKLRVREVRRNLLPEMNNQCELDPNQPAQVCLTHGHPINCPTPPNESDTTLPFYRL